MNEIEQNDTVDIEAETPEAVDGLRARALLMFIDGVPVGDIARELGVSRGTLWYWRQRPDFAEQLKAVREAALKEAKSALKMLAHSSVELLKAVIEDPFEKTAVRVKAAEIVLQRVGLEATPAEDAPDVSKMSLHEKREHIQRALELVDRQLSAAASPVPVEVA